LQLSAFLNYVVREELAGRGNKIKAYTVAVDALGRPETFDASSDPVIRVVANRLRHALNRFNAEPAVDLPVRIKLVKGSYRPVFTTGDVEVEAADTDEVLIAPNPSSRTRRCRQIITVLSILLVLALTYMVWDLGRLAFETTDPPPLQMRQPDDN